MKYAILLAAAFSCNAFAGAAGGFTTSDAGIVTPDVATGMRSYKDFNNDTAGNMVVCLRENKSMGGECQKWTPIQQLVPTGRKYVGFRIVSGGYGYRELELYWK